VLISGSPQLSPHQREAVSRAREIIANRGGVLLADEVGLGKSFVAAAIASEWRGEVELIVPASLVAQWRETLAAFGCARVQILTHDGLRRAEPARASLVIVDEAHAFRNPATLRYDALARRTAAASLLLVSATPVCNSAADLEALIALIARDDLLSDCGVPSIDLAFASSAYGQIETIVRELVIRRDRSVLPGELAFGDLERTIVRHALPEIDGIDALQFPLAGATELLRRFLWRRLESSEAALLESLRRQRRFYERVLESGRAMSKRDYRLAFGAQEDAEVFQQILFWDLFAPREGVDVAIIREEMIRLGELRSAVERSPCTKRDLLAGVLTDEPTLIFTQSAATARDLAAYLKCGVATSRDGRSAIDAFRRGRCDRLVATDLASEGLNLQRAAVVVHYDLPWSPVKLDQRNGRAHRIGQQREKVRALYFVPESRGIMSVIARKNRVRKRILRRGDEREGTATTLRPRVTHGAAVVALIADGADVPEWLERRHCAGLERLLRGREI